MTTEDRPDARVRSGLMRLSVVVEADGAARGNPGPAGYGAVVLDAVTGAVLAERSGPLGVATNNEAEYRGLIAGLGAAAELGATDVLVRLDSQLVDRQMRGALPGPRTATPGAARRGPRTGDGASRPCGSSGCRVSATAALTPLPTGRSARRQPQRPDQSPDARRTRI